MRFPSKSNAMRFLTEIGIEIGTVIDVGAQAETAELRTCFPKARHLLFEPAVDFHADLARNYAGLDHEIIRAALSDEDGSARLHKVAVAEGRISHAGLVGPDFDGPVDEVPLARLDTEMAKRDAPRPFLLKVDVDGLEMAVLRGAEGIWPDVACVVVEATMASFVERLNLVASKGFRLFDLVDQCYYRGILAQMDLVFLAEGLFSRPELRPFQTAPFAWDEWIPIAHFEPAAYHEAAVRPIYGKRRR